MIGCSSPYARPDLKRAPWNLIYGGPLNQAVRSRIESGSAPSLVEAYISDECALHCKHCFHGNVQSKTPGLSLAEWQGCLEQFIALGTRRLHFAGREPFLSPDLIPLLGWLRERKKRHGLTLGAITDGFSCAPLAGQLRDAGLDYLDVSVEGVREDHERLRGRGTYERTIRALELLIESLPDVCVSVCSVLDPTNAPRAAQFIAGLHERGVRRFFFQPVQALGYAAKSAILPPATLRDWVRRMRAELAYGALAERGVTVMLLFPVDYLPDAAAGDEWLESCLEENLRTGKCTVELGRNRLMLEFEIMRVPFMSHLIVSHDGYMLARCAFRSVQDYDVLSPGNVRSVRVSHLLDRARTMTLSVLDSSHALATPVSEGLRVLQ